MVQRSFAAIPGAAKITFRIMGFDFEFACNTSCSGGIVVLAAESSQQSDAKIKANSKKQTNELRQLYRVARS